MGNSIYLDYAATTPIDPEIVESMLRYMGPDGVFGNSASNTHHFGLKAREAVERARDELASLINAEPNEVIWTSGATESVNLAIKGIADLYGSRGSHIVTSLLEHKAVLDSCRYLEQRGFHVTYLRPDSNGLISSEQVEEVLRPETILVSLMHVNNEIGTVTDINSIASVTSKHGIPLHIDAAQSIARLKLDMQTTKADLVSMSGHKMYGPKGIGALYVRRSPRLRIQSQIHGGGHEQGLRSGTLATHQIVGMGEAARLIRKHRNIETAQIKMMSNRLLSQIKKIERISFNGNQSHTVPGIVNVSFACVESESLIMMLDDIAISTGSACTSASVEPSHVLTSLGLDEDTVHSSIRISFGRFTTADEIDCAVTRLTDSVSDLRGISPNWITGSKRSEVVS